MLQIAWVFGHVVPGPNEASPQRRTALDKSAYLVPERRRQTAEIHRRLKPGAPLVVVHFSLPAGANERTHWLTRYADFAASSGVPKEKAAAAATAVSTHLHILTPEEEEALLHTAGFKEVKMFYAAFAFRGWVAWA